MREVVIILLTVSITILIIGECVANFFSEDKKLKKVSVIMVILGVVLAITVVGFILFAKEVCPECQTEYPIFRYCENCGYCKPVFSTDSSYDN